MKKWFFLIKTVGLILFLVFLSVFDYPEAKECEVPTNAKASEILPTNLISGPYHRIKGAVVSHGYMYNYTVDSNFGVFDVTGQFAQH